MYSTAINTSDQLLFSSATSSSHSSQASPNQSSITEDLDSNNESSLTTLNDHIQPGINLDIFIYSSHLLIDF